jgi:hypothetical protein
MEVLLRTIGPKLLWQEIPEFSRSGPLPGGRDLNFDFMLWISSGKVKESLGREGLSQQARKLGVGKGQIMVDFPQSSSVDCF